MPRRALDGLTESMFYVLMALSQQPMCGIDIAAFIEEVSQGRVQIGPATLYTILAKFEKEAYIRETEVTGRKRTYAISLKGRAAYRAELGRLQSCLRDDGRAAAVRRNAHE